MVLPLPNVILLMADDQGWGDVGFNPHALHAPQTNWTMNAPRTPNLDAMARSENSIVFWSFYAGSALCSPTRSAALTGRTPNRECISAPEPHGYGPSYSCFSPLPLSPRTVTIAEVAKSASYDTFHSGKWHLGDFFPKRSLGEQPSFANAKWPVSNPSTHGFDAWHSTEASGPSSTPNCGCDAAWKTEGQGCVSGGGVWRKDRAWVCMDYWSPDPNASAVCKSAHNATLAGCVVNETSKIQGDDAEHIIESFETFLDTREGGGGAAHTRESEDSAAVAPALSPFLAVLWLHTIHFPRGALPRYYHAYNDTFGDPAGDYLGSITQMDVQVGRLRELLRSRGIAENTMLWYTSDNGPNAESQPGVVGKRDRSLNPQYAATNGLRQCKASLYEGGIRVPGILEVCVCVPEVVARGAVASMAAVVAAVVLLLVLRELACCGVRGIPTPPTVAHRPPPTRARSLSFSLSLSLSLSLSFALSFFPPSSLSLAVPQADYSQRGDDLSCVRERLYAYLPRGHEPTASAPGLGG